MPSEISSDGESHSNDAAFTSRVGSLAYLTIECGNAGCVEYDSWRDVDRGREEGGREGGRRERGREGGRGEEGQREGGRNGGREEEKEGQREGGKEGWREGGKRPCDKHVHKCTCLRVLKIYR